MTKAQAAPYLAGMIDGEGHVRTNTASRNVSVSNTDPELIAAVAECCELLGLHYTVQHLARRPPRKEGWEVVITGKDSLMAIQKRVPIQCHRKQAALAESIAAYKQLPRPPREWLEQKYWTEGLSLQAVAEAWGAKNSTSAWCWLQYYGIPRRESGGTQQTKYPRPEREWLQAKVDEGLTLQQIGDLVDAPLSAVWRWCQHYRIDRESKRKAR